MKLNLTRRSQCLNRIAPRAASRIFRSMAQAIPRKTADQLLIERLPSVRPFQALRQTGHEPHRGQIPPGLRRRCETRCLEGIAVTQRRTWACFILGLSSAVWVELVDPASAAPWSASSWLQRLEEDWLVEARLRSEAELVSKPVTTRDDAAGGCDGVIDGQWGFHTGQSPEPWWQVDLGTTQQIDRVVIWNRCQAAERAARLRLRLSNDGQAWRTAYQHDGTVFYGFTDKKPLEVRLTNAAARLVRVQLPGTEYLHLDEVQVFGPADLHKNLALHRPADQVSVSQWSVPHIKPVEPDWAEQTRRTLAICERLARECGERPLSPIGGEGRGEGAASLLRQLRHRLATLPTNVSARPLYLEARRLQRQLALSNPALVSLLDFDALLFSKRVPPSFNHMSDQYYGWWSKPGGGLYLLRLAALKADPLAPPQEECLTSTFTAPGSFLRPTLSYDGRKVLFAWCRYYPHLAGHSNKLDKANVPEDAFYHLFEMNLDGTGLRQLTRGKYDDFDGRYLPDGRIVFLSTRRGQFVQVGRASAAQTLARPDLPDCYVRCGGGPERPVAVYTLHTMNADGSGLCAISPFEMFEWTPEVARDGSILYSRWDYVDRDNMPYMGLWAIRPDGSNARLIYGNYTRAPHCTFEPRPIPGSHKIVFTASAHHAQTMGSLVLLDPSIDTEGAQPITRLTPEVPFPEAEGWPKTSYANPWPLSERFYLVAWGCEGLRVPGPSGWDRWHAVQRPPDGMALYLFDAATGTRELLVADPQLTCGDPIPVRPRERPPVLAESVSWDGPNEGRFLLMDVYRGLTTVKRGDIRALRVVAIPAKTHPTMNFPNMGITADDPGKCVLGTVPVEPDGSAYFRVPAGVIVFFQALDGSGLAVQTMRSATHVQPGQTVGCIGCHEHRQQAPPARPVLAALRQPSKITPGPDGSWPVDFGRLVQPVLEAKCVRCHSPSAQDAKAAKFDLTSARAYENLISFGKPSLRDQVWAAYRRGYSIEGEGPARRSALMALLARGHHEVKLTEADWERLLTWMDTYAQRRGAFSAEQEAELVRLRQAWADLLNERGGPHQAAQRADTGLMGGR